MKTFALVTICALIGLSLATDALLNETNQELNAHTHKVYSFSIPSTYEGVEDLVIDAEPLVQESDPDIFVSLTNKNPHDRSSSRWSCSRSGKDICTISGSYLKPNQTFYVGVKCYLACKYSISSFLRKELEMRAGHLAILSAGPNDAKIFTYRSGNESKVTFEVQSMYASEKAADIYVRRGEDAPTTSDVPGTPAWEYSTVFELTKDSFGVRLYENTTYKMLVVAPEEGIYMVHAVPGNNLTTLGDSYTRGYVHRNERECYQYHVPDWG